MNFAERLAKLPKDVLVDALLCRILITEPLVRELEIEAAMRATKARWLAAEAKALASWAAYEEAAKHASAATGPEARLSAWTAVAAALDAHDKDYAAERRAYDRYMRVINAAC